jgi:rhodanese-related sulfurtransferase
MAAPSSSSSPSSSRSLVDAAMAVVTTVDVAEARRLQQDEGALIVDLREESELRAEGTVPGALHAPRGLLEFLIDPASPWHHTAFADASRPYVLFCGIGWRSALAAQTMQQQGFVHVVHLDAGFQAWKAAGLAVAPLPGA